MPKSQLIRLETSFKNSQKAQNVNIYQKRTSGFSPSPPPHSAPAYGLYTCENVNNYGWPLNYTSIKLFTAVYLF